MNVRSFLHTRSISFRLYLIIIPTIALVITILGYLDGRFYARVLESQVEESTQGIAGQLADDLARQNAPTNPDRIRRWLGELVESNFYIQRIDVYRLSGGGLVRFVTTSTSQIQPIAVDELAAVRESKSMVVRVYQEKERLLKVIAPIRSAEGTNGCVTVTATLKQSDLIREVHDRVAAFMVPISVFLLVLTLHFLFSRVLTRRMDRLIHAINQARTGDLAKRAAVERRDELGIIAQRYNEMMEEIEKASLERDRLLEELRDFNAQLQDRVREATGELSSANERLRQVNQDLIDAQRRLTRAERAAVAGQMAAAFAHEIGSPLSAISTHLDLMSEDLALSPDTQHRLKLIQEQVDRITIFVEELLSETRLSAAARGPVQINQLLQQLLLFMEQHLERNHVEVETRFSPDLPDLEANPQQLQQVFLNLLNNACDAMPRGGVVKVETDVYELDGERFVAAIVTDNGIGIPQEKQGRIFEPYFTTKDLHRGTGLGLSIAAKIVRQHDGTIELESAPGKGARFTVRFRVPVPTLEVSQAALAER